MCTSATGSRADPHTVPSFLRACNVSSQHRLPVVVSLVEGLTRVLLSGLSVPARLWSVTDM